MCRAQSLRVQKVQMFRHVRHCGRDDAAVEAPKDKKTIGLKPKRRKEGEKREKEPSCSSFLGSIVDARIVTGGVAGDLDRGIQIPKHAGIVIIHAVV